MSISRTVYAQRENLPSPQAWTAAIRAAGFPMEMDADFEVERFSGFLPCNYNGRAGGFEYFFSTLEDLDPPDVGDRDVGITFVTHSSMRGLVTAVIAAAVLCEATNGVLHDEEADELIAARDALANAREMIASIGDDLD
jgi:hypothetical protein